MNLSRIIMILSLAVLALVLYNTMTTNENFFNNNQNNTIDNIENFDDNLSSDVNDYIESFSSYHSAEDSLEEESLEESFQNNTDVDKKQNEEVIENLQNNTDVDKKQNEEVIENFQVTAEYPDGADRETLLENQKLEQERQRQEELLRDEKIESQQLLADEMLEKKESDDQKISYNSSFSPSENDVARISSPVPGDIKLIDNQKVIDENNKYNAHIENSSDYLADAHRRWNPLNSIITSNGNASQDLRSEPEIEFDKNFTPFNSSATYGSPKINRKNWFDECE